MSRFSSCKGVESPDSSFLIRLFKFSNRELLKFLMPPMTGMAFCHDGEFELKEDKLFLSPFLFFPEVSGENEEVPAANFDIMLSVNPTIGRLGPPFVVFLCSLSETDLSGGMDSVSLSLPVLSLTSIALGF